MCIESKKLPEEPQQSWTKRIKTEIFTPPDFKIYKEWPNSRAWHKYRHRAERMKSPEIHHTFSVKWFWKGCKKFRKGRQSLQWSVGKTGCLYIELNQRLMSHCIKKKINSKWAGDLIFKTRNYESPRRNRQKNSMTLVWAMIFLEMTSKTRGSEWSHKSFVCVAVCFLKPFSVYKHSCAQLIRTFLS